MGRKTKLNPQLQERICQLISAGNYIRTACQAVGISGQTYINWMKRGEKSQKGSYFEFFEAVKKAEAQAIARNVAVIQSAAKETWQAAAWWLERKHPQDWGKKERHEHVGKDGEPIHLDVDPRTSCCPSCRISLGTRASPRGMIMNPKSTDSAV